MSVAQAFILSRGKTHYMTLNRGETWQKFEMPLPPAMIGRPLSFHSDPAKWGYILYQGTVCPSNGGWGEPCHDEVRLVSALASLHTPSVFPYPETRVAAAAAQFSLEQRSPSSQSRCARCDRLQSAKSLALRRRDTCGHIWLSA